MYAGISWCLVHLMTKDPKHLEKVRQEIARVSDKHGGGGVYTPHLSTSSRPFASHTACVRSSVSLIPPPD
jgi:hypothetical protein